MATLVPVLISAYIIHGFIMMLPSVNSITFTQSVELLHTTREDPKFCGRQMFHLRNRGNYVEYEEQCHAFQTSENA